MEYIPGKRVRGPDLPESNYLDAVDNLSRAEIDKSVWEFGYADPEGLWEAFSESIPLNQSFHDEVEVLKALIVESKVIDPITADSVTPWAWLEGQHRLKVAVDLGLDRIPGFFRVE